MPLEIGPRDGRKARRKRCDACVQRRIKCDGGVPCEYCRRTHRSCQMPIKPVVFTPIFVDGLLSTHENPKLCTSTLARGEPCPLVRSPSLKGLDRYLPYFFTCFMPTNIITSDRIPLTIHLAGLAKASDALRDAIYALAVVHYRQQGRLVAGNGNSEMYEALQAYSRSVRSVQNSIASNTFLKDHSALWTTFLLGLFELMRDSTGINWLSHFLHGTCTILRLQDPSYLASPGVQNAQKRTFFLATRIFEIARALIYSSPTFLSSETWKTALVKLWEGEGQCLWHPKEALFDLLPCVADLSIRAIQFCENIDQLPVERQCLLIQSFADEGLALQKSLQQWWTVTAIWKETQDILFHVPGMPDTELLVGQIYYHSVSIYLSGTYDYHAHWGCPDAPCAPILPRATIDWHVSQILRLSHELLALGTAGVLLFFPLRVAGARAIDVCTRNEILELLRTIAIRGFVVAEAFQVDLVDLWID